MADLTLDIVAFMVEALRLEFGENNVYETDTAIQGRQLPGVGIKAVSDDVAIELNSGPPIRRLSLSIAVAHDSKANAAAARGRVVNAIRGVWLPAGTLPNSLTLSRRTFGQESGETPLYTETLEVQIQYSDEGLDLSPV